MAQKKTTPATAHAADGQRVDAKHAAEGMTAEQYQETRGQHPFGDHGSSAPREETVRGGDAGRDSWLGTDRGERTNNVSWGAIFAGVMTFLAVLVLLGVLATALGLSAAGGTAVGIWSVVTLLLGLAAAGFVSGALGVRSGLLHGLVTWATSLVGLLVAVALVGSSLLGAVGGVVGGIANTAAQATNVTTEDVGAAADQAQGQVDQQDVEQAQGQAQQAQDQAAATFEQNGDELAQGAWWTFAGLLLGGVVSSLAGVAGARAVHQRETELRNGAGRRVDA